MALDVLDLPVILDVEGMDQFDSLRMHVPCTLHWLFLLVVLRCRMIPLQHELQVERISEREMQDKCEV